jgi:hypothetical protein
MQQEFMGFLPIERGGAVFHSKSPCADGNLSARNLKKKLNLQDLKHGIELKHRNQFAMGVFIQFLLYTVGHPMHTVCMYLCMEIF